MGVYKGFTNHTPQIFYMFYKALKFSKHFILSPLINNVFWWTSKSMGWNKGSPSYQRSRSQMLAKGVKSLLKWPLDPSTLSFSCLPLYLFIAAYTFPLFGKGCLGWNSIFHVKQLGWSHFTPSFSPHPLPRTLPDTPRYIHRYTLANTSKSGVLPKIHLVWTAGWLSGGRVRIELSRC